MFFMHRLSDDDTNRIQKKKTEYCDKMIQESAMKFIENYGHMCVSLRQSSIQSK